MTHSLPRQGAHGDTAVDVSVVVPVTERPEPLGDLFREYSAPLREGGFRFEFLFALEPWGSELASEVTALADAGEPVRAFHGGQNLGEAGLLRLAATEARGSIVVTLPSYHRVVADVLPQLIGMVEQGVDLAVAVRSPRRDSWINKLQSRIFHIVLRRMVHNNRLHDIACGVRAMRRELLLELPLYGDFFRFLPLLAIRDGYIVEELAAPQHEKDFGPRVYRPGVYLRRAVDLFGLFFLVRFIDKPLRFFGLVGSVLALIGSVLLGVLIIERLGGRGIADRPLLLLGTLTVVVGIQAIALGLVGEIIVHLHAPSRPVYRVADGHREHRSHEMSAQPPVDEDPSGRHSDIA